MLSGRAWEQRSDRDLTVAGRRSRRFYSFATRWMVNEVALSKANRDGGSLPRRARLFANARLGRLGMALTGGEIESADGKLHAV
ncbi:MAG: hypothetical protein U0521_01620 [Anaerolineae bacterium]